MNPVRFLCLCALTAGLAVPRIYADVTPSVSVAAEVDRKSPDANKDAGSKDLDNSFVRCEPKLKAESAGMSGFVQLRFQQGMAATDTTISIRQAYFKVPVSILTVQAGRWYEIYTPGAYFGRYLFGVSTIKNLQKKVIGQGSGSMCVNYTLLDGLRLSVPLLKNYKTDLHVALLPSDMNFQNIYTMIMVTSQPIECLTAKIAANLKVAQQPDTGHLSHRAMATATYQPIKDLDVFAEYGITDLSNASDSSWVLAGLDIPTGGILNMLRVEMEYHKDRIVGNSNADIGLMAILRKNVGPLQFDLDVGSDPQGLGSTHISQIGAMFRTTASF